MNRVAVQETHGSKSSSGSKLPNNLLDMYHETSLHKLLEHPSSICVHCAQLLCLINMPMFQWLSHLVNELAQSAVGLVAHQQTRQYNSVLAH